MFLSVGEQKSKPILKLKGLRAEYGFTQSYVAEALGISPATYSRKENGIQEFNRREIEVLLCIFRLKYDDVFSCCK